MAKEFRVVDCRSAAPEPHVIVVTASNAEHAARLALGEDLVRSGRGQETLRARVYSMGQDQISTMVRLHRRVET